MVFTEDAARPIGLPAVVESLWSRPGSGIRGLLRLMADVATFWQKVYSFDAVHACTETHVFLAWLSCKPYVVSTHGTYMVRILKHRVVGHAAARAFASAGAVIVTSENTYEQIKPYVQVRRTEQLPNGVDTTLFHRDDSVPHSPHTFITVGAIKPRKGQDVGILALALLKRRFPDSRYIIVGKAEFADFRKHLDALISEHHLSSLVIFAGTPSDEELVRLYNSSAVFILPSLVDSSGSFEGYPLSLLEASACGIPIIGSYECGAEHLIRNGENGFLVKSNDVQGLTDAVSILFEDPALANRMGCRAAAIAGEISWKRNAFRVIDIYRDITKNRTCRPV